MAVYHLGHLFAILAQVSFSATVRAGVAGGSWMVHGGGFYHANKFLVAPTALPRELHWFKYEAYFTWVTGFLLLGVVYYIGADEFLIDPAVMPLSPAVAIGLNLAGLSLGWLGYDALCRSKIGENTGLLAACVFAMVVGAAYGFSQIFAGRAAYIHVGAFLGTIMVANVFFIIIPNQKKVVADLIAGRKPDPALGAMAKQRSLHNNYLTLPVVLMMISNQYPLLYERANNWVYVAGILVLGGLVRHHGNLKDEGFSGRRVDWLLPAAGFLAVALIVFPGSPSGRGISSLHNTPGFPVSRSIISFAGRFQDWGWPIFGWHFMSCGASAGNWDWSTRARRHEGTAGRTGSQ